MKKDYTNLEYEVVRFEKEDIITASGAADCECDFNEAPAVEK